MADRALYDDRDRDLLLKYLSRTGRHLLDPLGKDANERDVIFGPSLSAARLQWRHAFGARRRDGTPFRAYPFFQHRPHANAFAKDLSGLHVCGMDAGLATTCFELASFVFAQADFMPDVGNAASECSPSLPVGSDLGFWISDSARTSAPVFQTGVGQNFVPSDPERRTMAHYLMQLMLRFVWFHELFHGLNGHSGFLAERHGALELNEMADNHLPLVSISDLSVANLSAEHVLHCFEIDADRSAFWLLFKLQLAGDEPFVELLHQPRSLRLRLNFIAVYLMIFMFEQSARRNASLGNTHPVPYDRLHNLVRTAASQFGNDLKKAFRHCLDDIGHLEKAVPALTATDRLLADLNDNDFQEALDTVESKLQRVRMCVARFSYVGE